jgi:hypothetical protein
LIVSVHRRRQEHRKSTVLLQLDDSFEYQMDAYENQYLLIACFLLIVPFKAWRTDKGPHGASPVSMTPAELAIFFG